jgi:hypothetical protein
MASEAVRHLGGAKLPRVPLQATDGGAVDLSVCRGRTVVYIYPRTGRPGVPNPGGWDMIPGARGCSPQSCAFRDHFVELKRLGVDRLYGLSTQDTAYAVGTSPSSRTRALLGRVAPLGASCALMHRLRDDKAGTWRLLRERRSPIAASQATRCGAGARAGKLERRCAR